jgi:Rrf2 family nitric oxide-sensitive transcriptional repressor
MRLTSYSNYTMRVLMVAAARRPALVTVSEVAEAFGVSHPHLVKCVHQLGQWGYLETLRGARGGFRLAMAPERINVGEVIRRTEAGFDIVECFDEETNTCPLIDACKLRVALRKATAAFLSALDELSVADLAANGEELLAALDYRWRGRCDAA